MTTPAAGNTSVDMLKVLGSSGAAPTIAPWTKGGGVDIATADFKALLGQAKRGELSSGRDVSIDPGLKIDLTPDQVKALSAAADKAEAAGLNRALVMIGGRGLVLDVASRSVTAAADMGAPGVLSQIDGVVSAGAEGAAASALVKPPVNPVGNLSLSQILAERDERNGAKRAV